MDQKLHGDEVFCPDPKCGHILGYRNAINTEDADGTIHISEPVIMLREYVKTTDAHGRTKFLRPEKPRAFQNAAERKASGAMRRREPEARYWKPHHSTMTDEQFAAFIKALQQEINDTKRPIIMRSVTIFVRQCELPAIIACTNCKREVKLENVR